MKNDSLGNDHGLERWVDDRLAGRIPGSDWQPDASQAFARFQQASHSNQAHGRAWTFVVAGAMVISVSLAAFPATRVFAQRCVSACLAESGKVTALLMGTPAGSNGFVKPGTRNLAADFTLSDASGRPVTLSEFRGKVVLLNFWATWCVPCTAEIPLLVGFEQQYHDRGFEVLGVALDEDGWKSVKPFLEAKHVNYPVMIADDTIARAYGGLEAVPMTLIIDKSGRIAATHVGICKENECEADIQALLKE